MNRYIAHTHSACPQRGHLPISRSVGTTKMNNGSVKHKLANHATIHAAFGITRNSFVKRLMPASFRRPAGLPASMRPHLPHTTPPPPPPPAGGGKRRKKTTPGRAELPPEQPLETSAHNVENRPARNRQ